MFVIPLKFLPLILIPIFLFYIGVKYFYGYWNRRGIYSPPALFPIGHLGKIAVAGINLGEYFQNWYSLTKKDHRCIGLYMVFKRTLLVNDLDLIKNILVKDYNYFQGHGFKSNKKADPVAQHLFNVEGPEWKEIRDKLSPTFTSSKLRKMVELMTVCAEEMVEYLRLQVGSENILDIKDLMGKYATEVTGSCGFGLQLNSFKYPDTEIRQMSKRALNKNIILAIIDLFAIVAPSLVQNLGLSVNSGDVTRFFCKFVPDAIAQRKKTNMQINDFLQVLMKLRDTDKISGEKIKMKDLVAQVFVFIVAGFESNSTITSYALLELARNPDVQEKLAQEIDRVLEESGGRITYDTIAEMTYLTKVLEETLRIYPILPFHFRRCSKDYVIPGTSTVIERGTLIFIPVMGIQRDPDIFPDPMKFDPDRFSPENVAKRHPFAYTPFGEGPRICIGKRFGNLQMKMTLITILKNYQIIFSDKTQLPLQYMKKGFFLRCEGNIYLQFKRREKKDLHNFTSLKKLKENSV